MSHRNARLTFFGRLLLVQRVLQGWAVAHAAKAQGVSRQCAHRWIKRYRDEGMEGLFDRSCRPFHSPNQTPVEVENAIIELRTCERRGQDWIAGELGVSARTVSRVLRRHDMPYLRDCDPMTGLVIRASKSTTVRYERDRPGELVHVDVKKLGKIPEGGGWRAHGRAASQAASSKRQKTDTRALRDRYDYVHSMVDDHSRLAYSEVLPDETGKTSAAFIGRAAEYFAASGIDRIEQVMTDNALAYTNSIAVREILTAIGAQHLTIKPHCPWQNGKVERFNRTLQTEWAYHQVFTSNTDRARALAPWLEFYNTRRRHSALGGLPPTSRLSPT